MADEKNLVPEEKQGDIVIYQTEDGGTKIDVRFEGETVWLTQQQMAELFCSSRTNIVEHIRHIYEEGELDEASTCRKFRQVRDEGGRRVSREIPHYNLDMIISLGYRVKSRIATHFRRWATERLKEYMLKGFTMDDERLKELGGGNYWKELLARIRISVLPKRSCIGKSSTYTPRAWTTIPIVRSRSHFSKWCKTSFIMPHMVTRRRKSYMNVRMRTSRLWG